MVEKEIMRNMAVLTTALRILLHCDGLSRFPEQLDIAINDLHKESEKMLLYCRVQKEDLLR